MPVQSNRAIRLSVDMTTKKAVHFYSQQSGSNDKSDVMADPKPTASKNGDGFENYSGWVGFNQEKWQLIIPMSVRRAGSMYSVRNRQIPERRKQRVY